MLYISSTTSNQTSNQTSSSTTSNNSSSSINAKQIKIGNYILGTSIGKGTSAVVKVATHALTKQKVAVKMFDRSVLDEEKQLRLLREIDSMKRLKHQNIIRLYEVTHFLFFSFVFTSFS
jgi:serine/threonine-protein kinase SIK3